jgi:hypothetical protein
MGLVKMTIENVIICILGALGRFKWVEFVGCIGKTGNVCIMFWVEELMEKDE